MAQNLAILGGFHPTPDHNLPNTFKTVLLLGPAEPGFWQHFTNQQEYNDGQPDPMDRWSKRIITCLANTLSATPFFPFSGPPYQPFIQWALATKRAHSSPVLLLVHDTAGLFVSYRGALAFDRRINLPAPPPNPCDACAAQPCLSACPVNALGNNYDVTACKTHLESAANSCMSRGCAARRACPVSQKYGRVDLHSAFHMDSFI